MIQLAPNAKLKSHVYESENCKGSWNIERRFQWCNKSFSLTSKAIN